MWPGQWDQIGDRSHGTGRNGQKRSSSTTTMADFILLVHGMLAEVVNRSRAFLAISTGGDISLDHTSQPHRHRLHSPTPLTFLRVRERWGGGGGKPEQRISRRAQLGTIIKHFTHTLSVSLTIVLQGSSSSTAWQRSRRHGGG